MLWVIGGFRWDLVLLEVNVSGRKCPKAGRRLVRILAQSGQHTTANYFFPFAFA
jgi:hypothetical protein